MSYEFLIAGTRRMVTQNYLIPTSSAIRIYEVFVVGSTANQSVIFTDNVPNSTATTTTNQKLIVPLVNSTTTYFIGQYSNPMGMRFDNSALFQTCSGIHFAVVNYITER